MRRWRTGRPVALLTLLIACAPGARGAPAHTAVPEGPQPLPELLETAQLRTFNRAATRIVEGNTIIIRLDEREGYGGAWVDGIDFAGGMIEVEVRGQDLAQRSFVGIAFHGVDDERYEAVFLRPFNFRSANPEARQRAMQYVSHPEHTWRRLREQHPGVYEGGITPAPDPNSWVRLRLDVEHPQLRVFIDDAEAPALVVTQLGQQRRGRVGLWVGNPSGGEFRNLRVMPE